jgi:hypothetical protein
MLTTTAELIFHPTSTQNVRYLENNKTISGMFTLRHPYNKCGDEYTITNLM